MKVNPRNEVGVVGCESFKFTITLNAQDVFYLRKHKESGRVSARHVLVEKDLESGSGWSRVI